MAITFDETTKSYTDGTTSLELNGDGVYEISSLDQLKLFRDAVNEGNSFAKQTVRLTASIDLNNEEWTPIGNKSNPFKGTFDGNGNTVSNLKITKGFDNTAENNYVGFFGNTNSPAVITNLTINNVDITGSLYVGAIVGNGSTGKEISNCHVTGKIEIDGWWYIGGIGGYGYMNSIDNCTVTGEDGSHIKGNGGSYVGGIWGFRGEGAQSITGAAVSNVDISGVDRVGGICGIAHYNNSIENCSVQNSTISSTEDNGNTALIAGTNLGNASSPAALLNNSVDQTTQNSVTVAGDIVENPGLLGANDHEGNPGKAAIVGDVERNADGEITGGTITLVGTDKDSIDVSNALDLPDGQKAYPNEDGTLEIDEAGYVATVGGVRYKTLDEAIAAAQAGETITLLDDVTLDSTLSLSRNQVFDLAGFTMTGNVVVLGDADVTFRGGMMTATSGESVIRVEGSAVLNLDNAKVGGGKRVNTTSVVDGIQYNSVGALNIVNSEVFGSTLSRNSQYDGKYEGTAAYGIYTGSKSGGNITIDNSVVSGGYGESDGTWVDYSTSQKLMVSGEIALQLSGSAAVEIKNGSKITGGGSDWYNSGNAVSLTNTFNGTLNISDSTITGGSSLGEGGNSYGCGGEGIGTNLSTGRTQITIKDSEIIGGDGGHSFDGSGIELMNKDVSIDIENTTVVSGQGANASGNAGSIAIDSRVPEVDISLTDVTLNGDGNGNDVIKGAIDGITIAGDITISGGTLEDVNFTDVAEGTTIKTTGTGQVDSSTVGASDMVPVFDETSGDYVFEPAAVSVNGRGYKTLAEAIAAAQDGDTITILGDISGETVTVDKNLTITGSKDYSAVLDNVIIKTEGRVSLSVKDLKFIGNSYINAEGAAALNVEGCYADVTPSKAGNNSRSAFIVTGTSENKTGLLLTVRNNTIIASKGDNPSGDAYAAAVFGWNYLADGSEFSGNVFGSENVPYTFVAVKTMNALDGASILVSGNTVYGSNAQYHFYAFDFYQNNSRDNVYTVLLNSNAVTNVNTGTSDKIFVFACVEVDNGTGHAQVQITDDNMLNGNPVTPDQLDLVENAYNYVGTGVSFDADGKITAGNFAGDLNTVLPDLAADLFVTVDGVVQPVTAADTSILYVNQGWVVTPETLTGTILDDGKYYKINAFCTGADAAGAVTPETTQLLFVGGSLMDYGTTIIKNSIELGTTGDGYANFTGSYYDKVLDFNVDETNPESIDASIASGAKIKTYNLGVDRRVNKVFDENITARLTIRKDAEVLVSESGAQAGHIWNRQGSEIVIEKDAVVKVYGELQNKGTITVSGSLEITSADRLGAALAGAGGTSPDTDTVKGSMIIDGGSVSYTGTTWIAVGGYTASIGDQKVREPGSQLSILNKGEITVNGVDKFRVYEGASMILEGNSTATIENELLNEGTLGISDSTLTAGTISNKGSLVMTGTSTLNSNVTDGYLTLGTKTEQFTGTLNSSELYGLELINGTLDIKQDLLVKGPYDYHIVIGGRNLTTPDADAVKGVSATIRDGATVNSGSFFVGCGDPDAGDNSTTRRGYYTATVTGEGTSLIIGQPGTESIINVRQDGILNVLDGAYAKTTQLNIYGEALFSGGNTLVEAASFNVYNDDHLAVVSIEDGAAVTVSGAVSVGKNKLRNGTLNMDNATLSSGSLTVGCTGEGAPLYDYPAGHEKSILNLSGGAEIVTGKFEVLSTGTVSLDYQCTISASEFAVANSITVNVDGIAGNGLYRIFRYTGSDPAFDFSALNYTISGDLNGYTVKTYGNGLYLSNVDMSSVYINSAWTGREIGEEVEPGRFYGVNAFDNMDKIYDQIGKIGGVGNVVLSSDITLEQRDDKFGEYGFCFKDDVVIDSDSDVQRVINFTPGGNYDLIIGGADQSRGSGNTKPDITIGENVRIQSAGNVWFGYYLAGNGSSSSNYLGNYAADITLKGDVELTSGKQAHLFGRGTVMTITETGSLKVAGSDIQTRGAKLIVNGTGKDMASAQVQLNHENVEGDIAGDIVGEHYDEAPASWELNNTFVNVNTYFGINTSTSNRASGIEATVSLNSSKLAIGRDLTMADAAKMILSNESEATVGGNVKLGNDAEISKGAEISVSGGSSFTVTGTATVQAGTTISVSDSAFSAGTLDNAGTVAVSGSSTLNIGTLTGTVTLADGTVLTATTVSGGTIAAAGSVSVNCEAFSGSVVSVAGTLNITDVVLPSGSDTVTLLNATVVSAGISVNGATVADGSFIFDSVKYNVVNHGDSLTVSMNQDNPYTPMSIDGTPVVTQADGTYDFTIDGFSVLGGEGEKTYSVVVRNGDTVVAESNGLSFSLADIPTYDSISVSITVFDKYGESAKLELSPVTQAVADWTAPEIGDYRIEQRAGKDVYDFNVTVDATDNFGPLGLKSYYRYAETPEALNSAEVREVTGTDIRLTAAEAGKTYFYQMMAVDRAGNESAWTAAQSFEVKDVTDPVILGSSVEQSADGYSFTVTADATDNVGVEKIVYRWATTEQGLSGSGADISEGFTVADNVQNFYYQVQAFDKAGNASGWSTAEKVAVNDVTAPVITGYSITRTAGTYNFTVFADGTDNFGVTEYLYRWAKTRDGLASSEWLSVATSLLFTSADAGQTYYYQVMLKDAAGNESEIGAETAFTIDQIPVKGEVVVIVPVIQSSSRGDAFSKTENIAGTVSKETGDIVMYRVQNSIASRASITLNGLEKGEKVKISVVDEAGKKIKSVTVSANKNGQVVLKDYLTPAGNLHLKVESAVRKGEVDYNMTVEQLYFKPASSNNDIWSSYEILADDKTGTTDGWVGYGDALDTYRISNGQFASALNFNFTSLSAKVKVTLVDGNGKKIKSMTLTAKNYEKKSFSNILLAAGKTAYLFVESTKGKNNLSADYTFSSSKEEFSNVRNDSMLNRTAAEAFVDGVSSNKGWVGYSDAADYYQFEIASSQSVGFDLTGLADGYKAGKQVKVALYNVETGKKVSLSSVKNSSSMDWITKKELDAGKYCAVVSIANEKKYRSDYSLNILANA